MSLDRDLRQKEVNLWCVKAFGFEHANSLPQRAIRLAEEVIEACQVVGTDPQMIHKLIDFVYARPVGELGQELGGISITLLALAQAAGLSAEHEEVREWLRIQAKPIETFSKRNQEKNEAGFNV